MADCSLLHSSSTQAMKNMRVVIFILLAAISISDVDAEQINRSSGKTLNFVGYEGKFLDNFPEEIEIFNLIVENSDMRDLTHHDFAAYSHVTNLEIRRTQLSFPEHNALFSELKKLRNLTIYHCNAGEEVAGAYEQNESLKRLSLRGNRISVITRRLFHNVPHLEEIDLGHNNILRMDEDALDDLENLTILNMEGNNLHVGTWRVLALSPQHCIVCRPESTQGHCSQADLTTCAAGLPLDRLWWRSPALHVKLQGNPLCDRVTAHTKDYKSELYVGDWNCQVITHNCFLHERRKLFLMEACGMNFNYPDNPQDIVTTSPEDEYKSSQEKIEHQTKIKYQLSIKIKYKFVSSEIDKSREDIPREEFQFFTIISFLITYFLGMTLIGFLIGMLIVLIKENHT